MRIRKRKVPLPIELLSPIPISSDPNLFSRPPVTLVQSESTHNHANINSQSSDHLTSSDLNRSIDDGNSSSDHFHGVMLKNKSDPLIKEQVPQLVGCLGFGGNESMLKSNDASNQSITAFGATADSTVSNVPSHSSHPPEKPMWCDDKGVPLKKRRGSTEHTNAKSSENNVKNMKDNNNDDDDDDDNSTKNGAKKSGKNGIMKRGKTIMEGSRCSRVNGRGWRCCQPTLVGYSLCEHHLGKGRLRSMSSVRGRPSSMTPKKTALGKSSIDDCSPLMQLCEAAKKETEMLVGKRGKLGVVKARSLSSLLGRTDRTSSVDISAIDVLCDEKECKNVIDK